MLFRPGKRFLIFFLVVDALFHTAQDFNLVYGFNAHTEVAFHHILVDNRACDTHALGANLQIGLTAHRCHCNSGTTESKQLFFYVFRNVRNLV